MGNLGWYQRVVTIMKKLGGPKKSLVLYSVGSYLVIRLGEGGIKRVFRFIKDKVDHKDTIKEYIAVYNGESPEGVKLSEGDHFKILEVDGDAALIEIIGNTDNPYVVPKEFLNRIIGKHEEGSSDDILM